MPESPQRTILVSTVCSEPEATTKVGIAGYSYFYVYQAFAPLLKRYGQVVEIANAESRLDYQVHKARLQNASPLHLSFLPLQNTYLTAHAPNVVFPFWEFPDIIDTPLGNNVRHNWVQIGSTASLILSACNFTKDAWQRTEINTPVHVVPVPVSQKYFDLPTPILSATPTVLHCESFTYPVKEIPKVPVAKADLSLLQVPAPKRSLKARLRFRVYLLLKTLLLPLWKSKLRIWLRPFLLPLFLPFLRPYFTRKKARVQVAEEQISVPYASARSKTTTLSGIVYTSLFNPHDHRKNWRDMLSAYLLALKDKEDATLVFKLTLTDRADGRFVEVMEYYLGLKLQHKCKVIIIRDYLTQEQMLALTQATTYYLNASRAEGSCLPLQNFLASGRPGIAPMNTGMTDYFSPHVGFVVDSHRVPTHWPHDPEQRCTTTWHRIVWESLFDQIQQSYAVAKQEPERYYVLSAQARDTMTRYASAESVWPRLKKALDEAFDNLPLERTAEAWQAEQPLTRQRDEALR